MSLADFPNQRSVVDLLQRSLDRGRLGHAYLFSGPQLTELERVAGTLAKVLNCEKPPRRGQGGLALDCCDACPSCRQIDQETQPDVAWVRPESKSRVIMIDQMRELMQTIHLKPAQSPFKVAVIVAADRLTVPAANAFLKTLEEPPTNSILVLLSTEPQRILETVISRCLRLNFSGEATQLHTPEMLACLDQFSELASADHRSLLSRYRLLSVLLNHLTATKDTLSEKLTQRSPLERFDDIEPKLKEKWEDELAAAIEAEYRRQRAEVLSGVQWWLRDVWVSAMNLGDELFTFPQLAERSRAVARRISSQAALENLALIDRTQQLLTGNVQEALALEVGLLKLQL